jgi:Tfp pilus assembly protein PilF
MARRANCSLGELGADMSVEAHQAACELVREAYQYQMGGEYDMAVELYKRSLNLHPTAEAHTFLGWAHHFQGKLDEAIQECKKAIQLDPEYGAPYNDIGCYLMERDQYDEAILWLERALQSRRYDSYHLPHYHLGRAYMAKEMYREARRHLEAALRISPDYALARKTLEEVRRKVQ